MADRRFNEEEVAAILKYATEAQDSGEMLLPSGRGLTLTELEDIGREVGISREAMGMAVQRIGTIAPPARKFLGLPTSVGRTIDLDRKLTDDEWERLVVDLRETFDARGVVRQEGSLRQWTNGNLQANVEPTATGQRLRLRTVKGDAPAFMMLGMGLVGGASIMLLAAVLKGALNDVGLLTSLTVMATTGAGLLGMTALRLPGWARLRQRQMDAIAERTATIAKAGVEA
jgi:hypothetical protein